MDLTTRKRNLEVVCEGINTDYLQENIQKDLLLALSDHQSSRINRALNSEMLIFPIANSIYEVISINKNEDNTIYQTNTRVQSCTCCDILYRCDYEEGERCKHLWRIQFLTNLNALPKKGQNPSRWLFTEIQKDKLIFTAKGYERTATKLETLQYQIMDYNPTQNKTYRTFFIQWLDILRTQLN